MKHQEATKKFTAAERGDGSQESPREAAARLRYFIPVKMEYINRNMMRAPVEKAHRYVEQIDDVMLAQAEEYYYCALACHARLRPMPRRLHA